MEVNSGVGHKPRPKPLVIGLDLGTTYSGVNWQQMIEDETFFILGWPSSLGTNQDRIKVPSRLHYDDQDMVTGWGYEDPDGDACTLEWFKLALVPTEQLPPHLRDSAKLKQTKMDMQKLGIDATTVMAQYMDKITTHALREIKESIGSRDFELTPIHVVITVPAIWGNQEIEKMKSAAVSSILQSRPGGLTTYEFLSEPEAAVQAYAQKLQRKLRVGEIVMVLDLGGGTGDAICYMKDGVGEESYLELREAVPGDGDLCGAIFVDEAFEKLLLSKMPQKYKNIKDKDPRAWRAILSEQWHRNIKRNFEWKGKNEIWHVVLNNLDSRFDVQLNEEEIRKVFDSTVMPKILLLVERQIAAVKWVHGGKIPRIILPVGGFGRCPYVLQRLRERFNPSSVSKSSVSKKRKLNNPEIEIHSDKGETPWGAVCKGACQFGMRAQRDDRLVKSRQSRVSVGFVQNVPGSVEEGGRWDADFDDYMIPFVMEWLVRKGDSIPSNGKKSTLAMQLSCEPDGKGTRSERSSLYKHDGDSIPERFDEDDPGFKEYGVMEITASKPIEKLPTKPSASCERPVFEYNLEVEIVGGSVQLKAISALADDNGKEVGRLVLPELDTM